MYASAARYHEYAVQARWAGRAMAVILFVTWVAYFVAEVIGAKGHDWPATLYAQGAIIASIFLGYAIGWRKELVGGLLAILGTVTFLLVLIVTDTMPRDPNMAWFAVPGVLYLLARHYDRRSQKVSDPA